MIRSYEQETAVKKLYLIRHCKAAEPSAHAGDRGRPLAGSGPGDATAIGVRLAELGEHPELILCSSARRAVETATLVTRSLPTPPPIKPEDGLYNATPGDVLARIQSLDDGLGAVIVVGHNPTLGNLAQRLPGGKDSVLLASLSRKFPAGAVACLEFDTTRWAALAPSSGTLTLFLIPNLLT